MTHRKKATIAALVAVLATTGTALAATSEHSNIAGMPPGYLKINPVTCRFLHPEVDQPTGPSLQDLRRYVVWEDARDDVKLSCLNHRPSKTTAPDTDGITGYIQVTATGTGKSVTATCPAGDVVTGGGSPDEVTGSYPSSASAWTIDRDHLSPPTMTVTAVCSTKAAS